MSTVAPNLATLLREPIAARLIQKAGSLTNVAKYPASTVQILGAEKALFRALKTKSNTLKYGLLYASSFIGKAAPKNKGRISRFLANKCSIASRIDNFSTTPRTRFGEALKKQVEDRLEWYTNGSAPMKNSDAMKAAMDHVLDDLNMEGDLLAGVSEVETGGGATWAAAEQTTRRKKEKKSKKRKRDITYVEANIVAVAKQESLKKRNKL